MRIPLNPLPHDVILRGWLVGLFYTIKRPLLLKFFLSSNSQLSSPYANRPMSTRTNPKPTSAKHHKPQGKYWLLTIPQDDWTPPTIELWSDFSTRTGITFLKGQAEIGDSGYRHWQLVLGLAKKARLQTVKELFVPSAHCELTLSDAANDYVHKDETSVPGTRFNFGQTPMRRNSKADWAAVRIAAIEGRLSEIEDQIFVTHYCTLKRIAADHQEPLDMERTCTIFWGPTGTGKSRKSRELAKEIGTVFNKIPSTKWWCGYKGQPCVVIDEFTGEVGITHFLRWFDRYGVSVEVKGGSVPLQATHFWITSNVDPRDWWKEATEMQKEAFKRRVNIVYCPLNMY